MWVVDKPVIFLMDSHDSQKQMMTETEIYEHHRRASRWFAEESLIDEAVSHAIAAKDFEFAASTLEGSGNVYFAEWRVGEGLRWSRMLPEAVIARFPRLLLHLGLCYSRTGQNDIAQQYLQDARTALELAFVAPTMQIELNAYANLIEANLAILRGDASRSLALVEATIAVLPADNLRYRHFAFTIVGVAHRTLGNFEAAERAYSENYEIASRLRDGELLIRTVVQAATTRPGGYIDHHLFNSFTDRWTACWRIASGLLCSLGGGVNRRQHRWHCQRWLPEFFLTALTYCYEVW
jgi:ATP/maltotriose-dependent transcriptional regulator MalT